MYAISSISLGSFANGVQLLSSEQLATLLLAAQPAGSRLEAGWKPIGLA